MAHVRRMFTPPPVCDPFLSLYLCEQHLSTSADVQTVKKDSSNEVEKIICEEKDNDHQVITTICSDIKWCFDYNAAITWPSVRLTRRCFCKSKRRSLPTCIRRFLGRTTAKQWEHNLNSHPHCSHQHSFSETICCDLNLQYMRLLSNNLTCLHRF